MDSMCVEMSDVDDDDQQSTSDLMFVLDDTEEFSRTRTRRQCSISYMSDNTVMMADILAGTGGTLNSVLHSIMSEDVGVGRAGPVFENKSYATEACKGCDEVV